MSIEASYHSEVRFVRSAHSSKTGTTITLALPDSDELSKVAGFDGKRYMLALVEIGDDEQPVQKPAKAEKLKGGALSILAARWCEDPVFRAWYRSTSAIDAAGRIRAACGISTRAELDHNPQAADLFQCLIRGPYMKHLLTIGRVPTIDEVEA